MQEFTIPRGMAKNITKRRGRIHSYEAYDSARTAFLVVDMQNYFVEEGEQGYCAAARNIVPNINRLARAVRETGGLVVWIVMEASEESRQNWQNFHQTYLPENTEKRFASLGFDGHGFELWHELEAENADQTVIKARYSAFIQDSSNIEAVLRQRDIETVLVGGVATNVCCDSTARDCMMRGFRTLMVSDANASFTEEEHIGALRTFISVFGDVQSTDEVITRLIAGTAKRSAAG
jgi:ureidoacrylate peracid hydrolase